MKKQGKDMSLLLAIIRKLQNREMLDAKHRDHPLQGEYSECRECHITPDWLLIYSIDNEVLVLTAVRTGSHSDLF
ncbi:MAG: type II toxin-antitoxin system YafQ family toxin [Fibromonadales bacterium]|nr:type II toxin-antitoxin system YafQ family toxin [Fibromonadales bacterium]